MDFLDILPPPSSDEVAVAAKSKSNRAGESASVAERKKKKRASRGKKRKDSVAEEQKIMDDVTTETKIFEGRAAEAMGIPLVGDTASGMPEGVSELEEYPLIAKAIDLDTIEMLDNVAKPVNTNGTGVADNSVLRKLLRGPRYFDPPESHSETCYNCGKEGHVLANCPFEKRKKPCFVCGNFGHSTKHCSQGRGCFICRKRGHMAKDCPEKNRGASEIGKICLRCGESGHDMPSCRNDYAPEDLKEIQCYICKSYGHLCCADIKDAGPREVSCYNCGRSGHLGVGCAKLHGDVSGSASPTLCYKCGEEGHFARGCTKSARSIWRNRELSIPRESILRECKYGDARNLSVPPEFGKPYKRKMRQDDKRYVRSAGKSKSRGGWIMDDPGDITYGRKYEVDSVRSAGKSKSRGGWIMDDPGDSTYGRNYEVDSVRSAGKSKSRGGWIMDDPGDITYGRNSEVGSVRRAGKSKSRGGWIMDGPGDIAYGRNSEVDSWSSPASMGRGVHKTLTSGSGGWSSSASMGRGVHRSPTSGSGGWSSAAGMGRGVHETPTSGSGGWHWESRSPLKRQKLFPGSSSSNGPKMQFHHDFTASRFDNNIQSHFWKSH